MFDKSLQYSFTAQKYARFRALRVVFSVLFLFLLYNATHSFLFSVWVVRGESMQPGLHAGDRLVVVSSALPFLFADFFGGGGAVPYSRGQIVLIDKSRQSPRNPLLVAADSVVRFFTAQQISILGREEYIYMKRLVALPHDEISMVNFIMRVRPEGTAFALTEFELARRPYYPTIPQVPALWDAALPFSGNMESVALGARESFVVSDDRSFTADSRTWGPIDRDVIIGRPVFRFWPLTRIGFL